MPLPHPLFNIQVVLILVACFSSLTSLLVEQGIKHDDSESAEGILAFIECHGLAVEEILDPFNSFSALRIYFEFFYQ